MSWSHMSKDGIATNKDKIFGGIVDKNMDGWFAIPEHDDIEVKYGFSSKDEAIAYIEDQAKSIVGVKF